MAYLLLGVVHIWNECLNGVKGCSCPWSELLMPCADSSVMRGYWFSCFETADHPPLPTEQQAEAFSGFWQADLSGRVCGYFLMQHDTPVGLNVGGFCKYHFHCSKEVSVADPIL